jgi:hypothetical protein
MDISKTLLKNGIKEMLSENEAYFKQNIEQALAVKLNESIFSVREEVSNRLFENEQSTEETPDLQKFIHFMENFESGRVILKDNSVINITENEKELVKNLFESLNSENRKKMTQEIFNNTTTFKQHIKFAQETRKLQ